MTDAPYILGVDPGLSGALCVYDPGHKRLVLLKKMPLTTPKDGQKVEINPRGLAYDVIDVADKVRFAVVEAVSARPGQGVTSMFRFGHSLGLIEGILAACAITTVKVPPSSWKMLMHLNQDKKRSQTMASELFPDQKDIFMRPKGDGLAEAALLAVYGSLYVGNS